MVPAGANGHIARLQIICYNTAMEPPPFSRVPDHKHCPTCGKPMLPNARFCCVECEEAMAHRSRFQRWTTLILVGVLVLIAILWVVYSLKANGA